MVARPGFGECLCAASRSMTRSDAASSVIAVAAALPKPSSSRVTRAALVQVEYPAPSIGEGNPAFRLYERSGRSSLGTAPPLPA